MAPRLPVLSARELLKTLERDGFQRVGQTGSHIRLKANRGGKVRIVVVPNHLEVARGTLVSILRRAGLSRQELQDFLG
jgi:predicted RNA binding protein YcfA (HicA-like mRNA interferase family)